MTLTANDRKNGKCTLLVSRRRLHPSLFEPPQDELSDVERVRLKAVQVERARRFGDVYLGLNLLHALELDEAFARGRRRRESA